MLKKTVKQLVAEANQEVASISPEEAAKLVRRPGVVFIDLREPGELAASGTVEGAVHVPRGLLEFQMDPESPAHKADLTDAKEIVLFCGSGGRSALAGNSLKSMGVSGVFHVPGGFPALKAAGAPITKG